MLETFGVHVVWFSWNTFPKMTSTKRDPSTKQVLIDTSGGFQRGRLAFALLQQETEPRGQVQQNLLKFVSCGDNVVWVGFHSRVSANLLKNIARDLIRPGQRPSDCFNTYHLLRTIYYPLITWQRERDSSRAQPPGSPQGRKAPRLTMSEAWAMSRGPV